VHSEPDCIEGHLAVAMANDGTLLDDNGGETVMVECPAKQSLDDVDTTRLPA
jgi:hypothetical protein